MDDAEADLGREKRVNLAHEADFALGAMQVRPSSREVVLDGKSQILQPRVMQVLVALGRRSGESSRATIW